MNDLLEFPVKHMMLFGFLVPNPKANIYIRIVLCELSVLATFIISIINYFYLDGLLDYIDNFEGTSAMLLIFPKLTFCVFYKSKIYNLIESRSNFWDTDNCSEAVKNNVSRLLKNITLLQKVSLFQIMALVIVGVFPSSLIARKLPLGTFHITSNWLYYFMAWLTCAVAVVVGACCVICFILLFLGVCYEVIIQFRILCDHLERLDVENINSEEEYENLFGKFKLCLEHHKFLLRFLQEMQDCFAIPILIMYLSTLPLSCVFMYAAFEGPSISIKITRSMETFNVLLLFSIYCLAITFMIDEASNISNAIYFSNWYSKHFINLKKSTQLMIQQSQRNIRITVLGGLADVNIATLINVARASFSICTVLRSLKD